MATKPSQLITSLLLLLLCSSSSAIAQSTALRGLGEVSDAAGYLSPIPLPVKASCKAGDKYVIDSLQDLYDNADKLDCIFHAGITPKDVPLGFGYGYVLKTVNTGFYNKFVQIPYQGDFVVKTQCGGQFYNIGWISVAGFDVGTSVWTIGNTGWEAAEGELPEGDRDSLLMDFTVNFEELCSAEGNESPLGLFGFSPFVSSIFPMSTFKDIGRVVGYDTDGGLIMLNKALIYAEGKGAQTVLIYAVKTFDKSAIPDGFTNGTELTVPVGPNGETDIEIRRGGLDGVIKRALMNLFDPTKLAAAVAAREVEHRRKVAEVGGPAALGFSPIVAFLAHASELLGDGQ